MSLDGYEQYASEMDLRKKVKREAGQYLKELCEVLKKEGHKFSPGYSGQGKITDEDNHLAIQKIDGKDIEFAFRCGVSGGTWRDPLHGWISYAIYRGAAGESRVHPRLRCRVYHVKQSGFEVDLAIERIFYPKLTASVKKEARERAISATYKNALQLVDEADLERCGIDISESTANAVHVRMNLSPAELKALVQWRSERMTS